MPPRRSHNNLEAQKRYNYGNITVCIVPALFTLAVWFLFMQPKLVMEITPKLWTPSAAVIDDVLPVYPKLLSQAWTLGNIDASLTAGGLAPERETQLLQEAASLLKLNREITKIQLHNVYEEIIKIENEKSITQRVAGMFSFINLIWFFSIIGVLAAIGPVLFLLAAPVVKFLVQVFTNLILPILIALKPVYEVLAYALAFLFIVQGARYNNLDAGFLISTTGSLGFAVCFAYSHYLHKPHYSLVQHIGVIFIFLTLSPMAIYYNSSLYGFLVVASLYHVIGFSVVCYGLCYVIGFADGNALERCVVASYILLVTFVGLKIAVIKEVFAPSIALLLRNVTTPFNAGIYAFGCSILFLALLIVSSAHYRYGGPNYIARQLYFILTVLAAIFIGNVYGISALSTVALTYSVLYAMEKSTELPIWNAATIWFGVLGGSGLLYYLSLFLHANPVYITALFDSSALAL